MENRAKTGVPFISTDNFTYDFHIPLKWAEFLLRAVRLHPTHPSVTPQLRQHEFFVSFSNCFIMTQSLIEDARKFFIVNIQSKFHFI